MADERKTLVLSKNSCIFISKENAPQECRKSTMPLCPTAFQVTSRSVTGAHLNISRGVSFILRMRMMMCRMMITVASAPPPSLLELQDGVAAGPEPHPRRSTRTDSKYLQGPFEKCKLMKARGRGAE